MPKDLGDIYSRLCKPEGEKLPEPARLFPVLADTSKERRTVSIFLACLAHAPEFGKILLRSLPGVKAPKSYEIETYTEVSFKPDTRSSSSESMRPDGLVILKKARNPVWTALVEAKVGTAKESKLQQDQLENYMGIAKENKIDALITISNDFVAAPHQHPVYQHSKRVRNPKVEVFHWSWTSIRTHAELFANSPDQPNEAPSWQRLLIAELARFLIHPSSGVKRFEQMPSNPWQGLLDALKRKKAGDKLDENSSEVIDVVASWHQETRDLALQLSRLVEDQVGITLSRDARMDPQKRVDIDAKKLAMNDILEAEFEIRNAAAPLSVVADLRGKNISVSMKLEARDDKTLQGQVGWLRKQLLTGKTYDMSDLHVTAHWSKNRFRTIDGALTSPTNPVSRSQDKDKGVPKHLEVRLIRSPKNFGPKKFITALEQAVPDFYEMVGQELKKWHPGPRKIPNTSAKETSLKSASTLTEADLPA